MTSVPSQPAIQSQARVRPARLDDSPGLARVQVDSYRSAYAGIFPQSYLDQFTYQEQEQDWRDWIQSRPDDDLYVVELARDQIVGYALARAGPCDVSGYDGELLAIHVSRSYQGQGLGGRLLATIARQLRRKGCRSLMLWVLAENRSRGFYERLGGLLLDATNTSGGQPEVAYGWLDIESLLA